MSMTVLVCPVTRVLARKCPAEHECLIAHACTCTVNWQKKTTTIICIHVEIEELDKHRNPIMYSKVKSMEHKTKIKLGVQNKEGELLRGRSQLSTFNY